MHLLEISGKALVGELKQSRPQPEHGLLQTAFHLALDAFRSLMRLARDVHARYKQQRSYNLYRGQIVSCRLGKPATLLFYSPTCRFDAIHSQEINVLFWHCNQESSFPDELDRQRSGFDLDAPVSPPNVKHHTRGKTCLCSNFFWNDESSSIIDSCLHSLNDTILHKRSRQTL